MGIFDLFNKEKRRQARENAVKEAANVLYNVTLGQDGELWLCFNGELIAPMSMLTLKSDVSECVALVSVMRELYVKRHL